MTFKLFSDTVDSYDGVLSEERIWSDAARTTRMMHAHRGGRLGATMRCATRQALGLTARRAPPRALGSHTRADAQPHAVVDRQQRRYHHAACEPAFPLGAGTEPERLDTWQDPHHAQPLGRGPAPRPGRPGRAPHGVSPCGVPLAGDAVGAAAGPAPGTHHRGLSRQSRADAPRVASPALRHLVSSGVSACARWGGALGSGDVYGRAVRAQGLNNVVVYQLAS